MSERVIQRGGWGGRRGWRWRQRREGGVVSVRLARFVLSLFVLEEGYERLPRRLALRRAETDEGGRRGREGGRDEMR